MNSVGHAATLTRFPEITYSFKVKNNVRKQKSEARIWWNPCEERAIHGNAHARARREHVRLDPLRT